MIKIQRYQHELSKIAERPDSCAACFNTGYRAAGGADKSERRVVLHPILALGTAAYVVTTLVMGVWRWSV